jgi:ketosteroid isomerase-like protein
MSQENVKVVRTFFAGIDRGDAGAWDLLPPDFVIDLSRRLIDPVMLHGPDEMRAFYRDLEATWADGARVEVEELIDAGDEVLALIRFGGRGKMSGADVEVLVWNLWRFRDGEPVSWTYFGEDRAEALEAAGLSE